MALDRHAVIESIKAILEAHETPRFTVVPGEPIGLPADGSPFVAFWYKGRIDPPEGAMTLGNRMNLYQFEVRCFWHRRPELTTLENFEQEIFDADVTLRAAFWADYTLNSKAVDLDITDAVVDYGGFPLQGITRFYRTLQFDLNVKELEGETLAA